MNGKEALKKVKDLMLGPEVEGTVSAYLPTNDDGLIHRFAVRTESGEVVDVHVSDIETVWGIINVFREPIVRGQHIKLRAIKVKPWVDGQII